MSEYIVYCVDYDRELDRSIFDAVVEYMVLYNRKYTGNFGGDASYDSFQSLMEGLLHGEGCQRSDSKNYLLSDNDTFPLAVICDCLYVADSLNYYTAYYDYLRWGYMC